MIMEKLEISANKLRIKYIPPLTTDYLKDYGKLNNKLYIIIDFALKFIGKKDKYVELISHDKIFKSVWESNTIQTGEGHKNRRVILKYGSSGMFEVICPEAAKKRTRRIVDIVKRLGIITPDKVHLKNYPIDNPATIFNPTILVEDENVKVYARIVLGYFTYASAVAELTMPLSDIYTSNIIGHYPANIVIYPSNRFDIWGVEDPRVYKLDDKLYMTYTGRTVNYFNPVIRVERTLPVTAVYEKKWRKIYVARLPNDLRKSVISDKDAFMTKSDNELLLFHRLHMTDNGFYLTVSKVPRINEEKAFKEIIVKETKIILERANFEEKIGWGPPPVQVGKEYLFLIHGVEKESLTYMVFAALLSLDREVSVKAVTPCYIMRPRMPYEIYGDRPYTIFPCGLQKVDEKLLMSYGAGDSTVAFGEIDLSELMAMLDKNRLD